MQKIRMQQLLIVDRRTETADHLRSVGNIYSWYIKHVTDTSIALDLLMQGRQFDAILVSEDIGPLSSNDFYFEAKIVLKLNVYLVLLVSMAEPTDYSEVFTNYPKLIKIPFDKKNLIILKNLTKDSYFAQDLYKLDYLEELSGGNTDFISESLNLFNTTLRDKLKQMYELHKNQDIENLQACAHSIKPNFEMLLNFSGRDICNRMLQEKDLNKLSVLLGQLEEQFKLLNRQIQLDHPHLQNIG